MRSMLVLLLWLVALTGAEAERLTPEKLWDLQRIGDAVVSPDGTQVAYLVTRFDLQKNEGTTSLMLQSLPGAADLDAGSTAVGFDTPLQDASARTLLKDVKGLGSLDWLDHASGPKLIYIAPAEPKPSQNDAGEPDSDVKADESKKSGTGDESGDDDSSSKPQAWMIDPAGGDPKQLTAIQQGIGNLKASPSGDAIAFTVDIKLDDRVDELYPDLPKADARIIDSLLYRHWNAWHDFAYSHVHVAKIDAEGNITATVDLMASLKADCPLPPFGGREQFDFSPDGKEVALTLKLVNHPAESTDSGIYLVSSDGGPLRNITPGMPGYDMDPAYSPDGRSLAFHSMARAGFESDRNRIMIYDRATQQLREVTEGLDQTTHHATWSPDSETIYFYSEYRGTNQIFAVDLDTAEATQISVGRFNLAVVDAIPGSSRILLTQQNMLRPTELALLDPQSKSLTTITDVNGEIFQSLELPKIEQRYFIATDGKPIHNWVILPPEYDENDDRTWPMLTYCQGGPQGQIGQWFSYRWNFHLMAAQGYVVLAVNRRGLPGFGRQWNDQISGDWGGQAMQDILASTDAMIANPKIDRQRVAAIGASFGGYTVYWLMGNAESRFCAMIAHCGVYNLESMYGATEELFFVNWDLGGPYWESESIASDYQRFSPHTFAGRWKTPLLIIHGEKDFRVPVTQGMEAFTAAQVQGVPSRFLYFPEEGHWVQSPQNGVLWGRVFFDWLDRYCKPQE